MPKPTAPDFDALLAAQPAGGGTQPKMLGILDVIGPEQAAKVIARAKEKKQTGNWVHSSRRIAAALGDMGHEISEGAVESWRKKL